jgi:hypothetical protein
MKFRSVGRTRFRAEKSGFALRRAPWRKKRARAARQPSAVSGLRAVHAVVGLRVLAAKQRRLARLCNFSCRRRHWRGMRIVETRKRLCARQEVASSNEDRRLRRALARLAPLLMLGLGCGGSSASKDPPSPTGSGGAPPAPTTMQPPAQPPPPMIPPEAIAAVTGALGMVADQVQAACGTAFDGCSSTPGCNEILACAARSACSGSACYCADADCETDGPCRSVIEGAPGARVPDAEDDSLGPAADAARRVGDCLGGLGGGLLPMPPMPTPNTGDAGDPSETRDAG